MLVARDLRPAFYAPFAISLVVPLACALAVWPFREVAAALRRVFSAPDAIGVTAESIAVLESLGAFCGRAALAGLAFSLSTAMPRILEGEIIEEWGLLGAYLALYSLLNAVAASSMAKVASRSPPLPARAADAAEGRDAAALLASAFGLTAREAEVAALIAAGSSYKEAAYELGISIKTVKSHISRAYEKTGCRSNVERALLPGLRSNGGDDSAPHTKVR